MTWLAQFQEGSIFAGDFQVLRPLKEGGMGAVYVARQLSTDKLRALKLMQPQLVREPRLRKRFQDEARVAARIKSRHVVEVIGAGVDDKTGLPWLAMELLEGSDLDSRVRETGPLSSQETREVFAQLCHAMGAAHDAGIVHRDLKPENIFLANEQQVGVPFTVKVLDFGIAKIRDDAQSERTNSPVGTATYMAPEQTTVEQEVTPAADVWSIGLIAFFVLTGKQYWKSANQQPCNIHSLIGETAYATLVAASQRATELGYTQALPAGFDAWFGRCVVRELDQRYLSATDAYQALGAVLGGIDAPSLSRSRNSVARAESMRPTEGGTGQPVLPQNRPRPRYRDGLLALGALAAMAGVGASLLRLSTRSHSDNSLLADGGSVDLRTVPPTLPDLGSPADLEHKPLSGLAPPVPKAQQGDARAKLPKTSSVPADCRRVTTEQLMTLCQDHRHARACHSLGERYAQGHCANKRPGFAIVMFQRACELGDESACSHL